MALQAPHPGHIARTTESWFRRHQRPLPWRRTYDPYQVWISEVMLQQTRMEVVLPYFERFMARFPSLQSLASARDEEVMSAWSGLGYYRRARMLRQGASLVAQELGGVLPSTVAELVKIPGIGRYTAGAIASIAWNQHAPIVDGNIARIVSRIFSIDAATGSPRLMREAWSRAEALVDACREPRVFNQGLMEIGALICKPRNPDCSACPLSRICSARLAGREQEFPRAKERASSRRLRVPLYLITDDRGRVLMFRENGPLMDAMYHLPHGTSALLRSRPLSVVRETRLGSFRHSITNRRVEFEVYTAALEGLRDAAGTFEWIYPRSLHDVPHPSYVRKALELAASQRTETT